MSCCTSGLDEFFTDDTSRRDAKRYRKHGLPKRSRKLLAAIESAIPLASHSSMEVGVGAGALTIEMLRRGATHAIGIDAVAAQLAAARELAGDFGVQSRLDLLQGDFANMTEKPAADIVVMDRVVCCYPDWAGLVASAAVCAQRVVALTYPRDAWFMKTARFGVNSWEALRRRDFRFHVHSPRAMQELLARSGLKPRVVGHYLGWEILLAVRAT